MVCVYPVFEYNTRCKFKNITMSCRQKIKTQAVFETKINRYVQISFFIGHFWVKLCNLFYASINVNGTGLVSACDVIRKVFCNLR